MKKLIVITGPTGAGKTSLSIRVAKYLKKAEIISADSRQLYRNMDVGTDKIDNRQGIPHHLIDAIDPDHTFTVAEYKKRARKKISEIQKRGAVPILCGGSWFYIRATVDGLTLPQVSPDWKFRKKMRKLSNEKLFKKLKKKDPRRAKNIDKQNKRRLIRALEIIEKTGNPVPPLKKDPLDYQVLFLGVDKDRDELEMKIRKRVDLMVQKGLEEEARKVYENYPRAAKETIGYKEWIPYFKKEKDKEEVVEEIKINTRQFAIKQINMLKSENRILWIKNEDEALEATEVYLDK